MIRKVIILGLTAAAFVTLSFHVLSYSYGFSCAVCPTRHSWINASIFPGKLHIFRMRSGNVAAIQRWQQIWQKKWPGQRGSEILWRDHLHIVSVARIALPAWVGEEHFVFVRTLPNDPRGTTTIMFPLSLPALAFAAYPSVVLVRSLQRRRRKGCCGICDYNLTGNTSGICPECGTDVREYQANA